MLAHNPTEPAAKFRGRAVVAGAGPVGAIVAIILAQQGWEVIEKGMLPPSQPSPDDRRAYSLTLTARSIRTFRLAGVKLDPIIAAQGGRADFKLFKADGAIQRSVSLPVTDSPGLLMSSRDEITRHTIEEARRMFPNAISFRFNTTIQQVDLNRQCVTTLTAGSKDTSKVSYDLLVGADGCIEGGVTKHASFEAHPLLKDGSILWDVRASGYNQVLLVLPQPQAESIRVGQAASFLALLDKSAPKLPGFVRTSVKDLVRSKPEFYPMPSWTHLSQLHGPKTVLLGDAAHTMSPVLGQGLNSSLEDVAVFAQCLEQHQGSIHAALPAYNRARLPAIQALMTLNEAAAASDLGLQAQDYGVLRRLWVLGHKLLLALHIISHSLLNKLAPKVCSGPHVMAMIMGAMPYTAMMNCLYQDGLMLAGVIATVGILCLYVFQ
ncbi:hypothetical protein WJX79_002794 [Trebouxia sp. C0005]